MAGAALVAAAAAAEDIVNSGPSPSSRLVYEDVTQNGNDDSFGWHVVTSECQR